MGVAAARPGAAVDGARWLAPMPVPGWIQAIITPQPTITVTAAGSPTPSVNPDTMLNFEAGVVPGAGLILVPAAVAAGSEGGQPLPWMAGESGEASETGAAEEGPVAAAARPRPRRQPPGWHWPGTT